MTTLVDLPRLADRVLRGEPVGRASRPRATLAALALLVLVHGLCYGAAMGTFGGFTGERIWQVVYSAVKLPFMLLATFAISLPSFFVLNTLFGLRDDFTRVIRALLVTQAGLTVILASLGPFTLFLYVQGIGYQQALVANGVMFAVSSASAQILLAREYEPLIRANPRHRTLLKVWLVVYVFVGIQMGWILRPFLGDPQQPVQFFREGSFTNAYMVVIELAWNVLTGQARR